MKFHEFLDISIYIFLVSCVGSRPDSCGNRLSKICCCTGPTRALKIAQELYEVRLEAALQVLLGGVREKSLIAECDLLECGCFNRRHVFAGNGPMANLKGLKFLVARDMHIRHD